jgi:protein SCO1/2
MKDIQDSLPEPEKKEVGYVLVSFDANRDGPAQLSLYAEQQGLNSQWVLLHGNPWQVRQLSMLLNVKYERQGNGDFSHSNALFILDRQGAIRQTLDGPGSKTALAIHTIAQLRNR